VSGDACRKITLFKALWLVLMALIGVGTWPPWVPLWAKPLWQNILLAAASMGLYITAFAMLYTLGKEEEKANKN